MRLDQLLVKKGLCSSRSLAQQLIKQFCVEINIAGKWELANKASTQLEENCELRVKQNSLQKYVSRAGLKLEGALSHTQFSVTNLSVLDVGQSTGGFTDCCLQKGAKKVVGVDVGHQQLHKKMSQDERVVFFEGLNARSMSENTQLKDLTQDVGLVVMDLSFISQKLVIPELVRLLDRQFTLISLVKPQFEVGKGGIGKGGLVKNRELFKKVEQRMCAALREEKFTVLDYFDSPIEGGDGNKEFFLYAKLL